ncbi:MAG TPA: hypothetical protein VGE52_01880 [Pirellulales bacterium]
MPSRRHHAGRGQQPLPAKTARKANQLCSQVERTLNYVLSGECDDDVLRDLVVDSVIPAPDDKHLLVTLAPLPASGDLDATVVLAHLARARDLLRREVAASITRKRVPELSFRFNPSLSAPPVPLDRDSRSVSRDATAAAALEDAPNFDDEEDFDDAEDDRDESE